ncbi:MAG: HIRAN domain-containing protein [Gemmatimonadota bacterium]|nr:HIRAN domain-containing protein [Gemmatimonadota bacterium]
MLGKLLEGSGGSRRDFFRKLAVVPFGGPALRMDLVPPGPGRGRGAGGEEPSLVELYLDEVPVAGLQFHQGIHLAGELEEGEGVEVRAEPHNAYDHWAVRFYARGRSLGYVPRDRNRRLAQLLRDSRNRVTAWVSGVHPHDDAWRRVWVTVRVEGPEGATAAAEPEPRYPREDASPAPLTEEEDPAFVEEGEPDDVPQPAAPHPWGSLRLSQFVSMVGSQWSQTLTDRGDGTFLLEETTVERYKAPRFRSASIPAEHAVPHFRRAWQTRIPLMGMNPTGVDGSTYAIELRSGQSVSTHAWWVDAGPEWEPLEEVRREMEALCDRFLSRREEDDRYVWE